MKGLSAALGRIQTLPGRAQDALTQAVDQAARETAARARAAAPVRTGALRAGIRVTREDTLSALVRVDSPYAAYVELGTRGLAARPFLGPAAQAEEFAALAARALREVIR